MAYEAEKAQVQKVREAFAIAMEEGRVLHQSFPHVEVLVTVKDGQDRIQVRDYNGVTVSARLKVTL